MLHNQEGVAPDTLFAEKKHIQALFDAAVPALAVMNDKGELVFVNHNFLTLFQVEADEQIIGRPFSSLFEAVEDEVGETGEQREQTVALLLPELVQKLFTQNRPSYNIELKLRIERPGCKSSPWLRINITELKWNERQALVSIENITKHKEIEADLMKYWNLYLTFFENFPTLIWRSGPDGRCDYFNKSWLAFTGKNLEEERGDGWSADIHPADRARCILTYQQNFAARQDFEIEYRRLRYDGEYRWVLDMGKPFRGLDGVFAGYIGSVHDITERKNATEGLKRYELLAEKASDIILFTDSQGRIIDANSAALSVYGYSREELLDKTVFDLRQSKPADYEKILKEIEESDQHGLLFEAIHYKKNGESFPIEVSSQGTELSGRRMIVSIIRDITERRKVELMKQKAIAAETAANRAKSEFLANMSHEIRTPLNGILGMIELTLLGNPSADQKENLTIAKTCANSLLKIIDDVLDFSKMEAGKVTLENVNFSVRDTFESVIKAHGARAESKGLSLYYQFAANLPQTLRGDPHRLQQVLNNLLGNAIKFTEQGKITVTAECKNLDIDQCNLLVTVTDSGIGISAEEQKLLFQSFSQVDGSHTRKYGGTGLGLAISKQLVELMGGTITVESAKGQGSTFSFHIPCIRSEQAVVVEEPQRSKTKRALTILLAEDNLQNQIVLKLILNELGHQVIVAGNGLEALQRRKEGNFDAILMDIQMPEMDGMEATLAIRAYETEQEIPAVPIIALTAHALQGDKERFLALGMDEYLAKPVSMERLEMILSDLAESSALLWREKRLREQHEPKVKLSQEQVQQILYDLFEAIDQLQSLLASGNIDRLEAAADQIRHSADKGRFETVRSLAFKIALAIRRGLFSDIPPLIGTMEEDLRNFMKVRNFVEKRNK
ncbi:MAG: PAS domain S-box protein [Sporomusaceae bacterium]|nr:PAS domain S-box protein [Sporomusaceae bacterium]